MTKYKITNATNTRINQLNLLSIFESVSEISSVVSIEPGAFIEFYAYYPDCMFLWDRFVDAVEALGLMAALNAPVENAVYMEIA